MGDCWRLVHWLIVVRFVSCPWMESASSAFGTSFRWSRTTPSEEPQLSSNTFESFNISELQEAGSMVLAFKEGSLPSDDKSHQLELAALRRSGRVPDIFAGRFSPGLGATRRQVDIISDEPDHEATQQPGQEQTVTGDGIDVHNRLWKNYLRRILQQLKKRSAGDTPEQAGEASDARAEHEAWESHVSDRLQHFLDPPSADSSSESSRGVRWAARGHHSLDSGESSDDNLDVASSSVQRLFPQRVQRNSPEYPGDIMAQFRQRNNSFSNFGRGPGRLNDAWNIYIRDILGRRQLLAPSQSEEEVFSSVREPPKTPLDSAAEIPRLSRSDGAGDLALRHDQNPRTNWGLAKNEKFPLQTKTGYNVFTAFDRTTTAAHRYTSRSPGTTEALSLREFLDIINAKGVVHNGNNGLEGRNSTADYFGSRNLEPGSSPAPGPDLRNRMIFAAGDFADLPERLLSRLSPRNAMATTVPLSRQGLPVYTARTDDDSLIYKLLVQCVNDSSKCASPLLAMARGVTTEATGPLVQVTWPLELLMKAGMPQEAFSVDPRSSARKLEQIGSQIAQARLAKEAGGIFVLVPGFLVPPDYTLRILKEGRPPEELFGCTNCSTVKVMSSSRQSLLQPALPQAAGPAPRHHERRFRLVVLLAIVVLVVAVLCALYVPDYLARYRKEYAIIRMAQFL
ncbi:unnamed protein product [Ixodes hexagonus]